MAQMVSEGPPLGAQLGVLRRAQWPIGLYATRQSYDDAKALNQRQIGLSPRMETVCFMVRSRGCITLDPVMNW